MNEVDSASATGELVGRCDCKVGTVSGRHDLQDVAAELKRRWTDDGDDRYSLRDLAEQFNRRVLRSAMVEAGMNPLEGEAENLYHLLTDDDASPGDRVDAERRLEHEGVPVETLRDDFVTHQTVYRHLKDCVGAEYEEETDPAERLERDVERIDAFQNQLRVVSEEIVRRLTDAGLSQVESPGVYVDVQILCEECGAHFSPRDLLENDACDCDRDAD